MLFYINDITNDQPKPYFGPGCQLANIPQGKIYSNAVKVAKDLEKLQRVCKKKEFEIIHH